MTKRRLVLTMGVISSFLSFIGCSEKSVTDTAPPPPPTVSKTPITFERQFEIFKNLGFFLNKGITMSDVDRWGSKKEFENPPYITLYMTLGQTIEREPWAPLTDRVWDFDVEAIEDHGAYVEIIKNLERISRGELKFENLKDYVDVEKENAWVSFSVRGKNYRWNLEIDNDYADPALFTKVVELTRTLNTKGRFTYFNTGGQNAVIGFESPESREAIIKATGLKIEWLN